MTFGLRDYQVKAITDLRQAFADGCNAPLLVMPTGSGKTYTYSAIAEGSGKKGKRILILEHRKELLRQCSLSLANLGVKHQIIAPSPKVADIRRKHIEKIGWPMVSRDSHVAVASVQTLIRRLDWLAEFNPDLIIVDEGDLALAMSWLKIFDAAPKAKILGVTATPCNTQGKGMNLVYDRLVLGPDMPELIEIGMLCRPVVYGPSSQVDVSEVGRDKDGDLNASDLALVMDKSSITGSAVQHYRELADGKPAIVFCASVKHAEHVAADFRASGYRFEVVTGTMEDDDRDDRIMGLASGKYHGIVAVDVISRGTDIPVAEVAIMLRPTESLSLYMQQIGRVLRPAEGKEFGLILDHAGNVHRHGLPTRDHEWTLEGRKKGDKKEASEKAISILQCPVCQYTADPRPICLGPRPDGTKCPHVFEIKGRVIEERAGKLGEITDENLPPPKIQTGMVKSSADARAAGMSMGQWHQIERARIEKDALRTDLRDTLMAWAQSTGRGIRDGWGFNMGDIRDMKPKALKQNIQRAKLAVELERVLANLPLRPDPGAFTDLTAEQIQSLIDQACDGLFHSKEISNGN